MKELVFETLPSTNTYAKEHLLSFDPKEITSIRALIQTKGRGTREKNWLSYNKDNLYLTYVFSLSKNSKELQTMSHFMAVTLLESLQEQNVHPFIKWPNDLFLNGKKFAGVLTEIEEEKGILWILVGVGININSTEEFMKQIDQPATSLFLETNKKWDLAAFKKKLDKKFEINLEIYKEQGFSPFCKIMNANLLSKDKRVNEDGSLL